jgi:hypothetical protein
MMISFSSLLLEFNEGWAFEMAFTRKLLYDLKNKKRVSIKGIGVIRKVEIPLKGKNVLLYEKEHYDDGRDYFRTRGLDDLIRVADQSSKADIILNDLGVSIKSFVGKDPSLASRINRKNFIGLLERANVDNKEAFLEAVDEHHDLCVSNDAPCTVGFDSQPYDSLSQEDKIRFVSYLAFSGTSTKESRNPAHFVIEISKSGNTFKSYTKEEFLKNIIDRVYLWIERNTNSSDPIKKWSLNIRIKK